MLSDSPYLYGAAHFFAAGFLGFGALWFIDIPKALSFFELPCPDPQKNKDKVTAQFYKTLRVIAIVYGIRDIFMGIAISVSAIYGTKQATGYIVTAAGIVAAIDGFACYHVVGKGQGGHWSYAPAVIVVGCALLGLLDWIPVA